MNQGPKFSLIGSIRRTEIRITNFPESYKANYSSKSLPLVSHIHCSSLFDIRSFSKTVKLNSKKSEKRRDTKEMFTNKTIFDAARKVRLDGKNVLITGANTG